MQPAASRGSPPGRPPLAGAARLLLCGKAKSPTAKDAFPTAKASLAVGKDGFPDAKNDPPPAKSNLPPAKAAPAAAPKAAAAKERKLDRPFCTGTASSQLEARKLRLDTQVTQCSGQFPAGEYRAYLDATSTALGLVEQGMVFKKDGK